MRLEDDRVVLLDQRRLPDEEVEVECRSAEEVADAIRTMVVRGAPAIGVAAAYGYALAAANGEDLDEAAEVLVSARPTAVNLPWAVAQMRQGRRRSRRAGARYPPPRGGALPAHGRARGRASPRGLDAVDALQRWRARHGRLRLCPRRSSRRATSAGSSSTSSSTRRGRFCRAGGSRPGSSSARESRPA